MTADGPDPGSWKGLAEMVSSYVGFLSTWEDVRIQPDDYQELDDERVLVFAHLNARGKQADLSWARSRRRERPCSSSAHGKVTRLVIYLDRDRALADLGLEA